jgi:hypothetical protein
MRQVIPLAPEPIQNIDGSAKQDCERNAGKRLLNKIRTTHLKLQIIITGDGLYANQPFHSDSIFYASNPRIVRSFIPTMPSENSYRPQQSVAMTSPHPASMYQHLRLSFYEAVKVDKLVKSRFLMAKKKVPPIS